MKVLKVSQPLTTLDGEIIRNSNQQNSPITIKTILVEALLNPAAAIPPETSGEMKLRKFLIAEKIHLAQEDVEIGDDDIKILIDGVGKLYPPLIAGQVLRLLRTL